MFQFAKEDLGKGLCDRHYYQDTFHSTVEETKDVEVTSAAVVVSCYYCYI